MSSNPPPASRRPSHLRLGCGGILVGLGFLVYTGTWALPFRQHGDTLVGAWSSDNMVIELTDSGGRYYWGCTEGHLAGPIVIDSTGTFSVTASVVHINPIPTLATPVPPPSGSDMVSWRGHVSGAHMDLQVGEGSTSARDYGLTFQALYTPPTRCP